MEAVQTRHDERERPKQVHTRGGRWDRAVAAERQQAFANARGTGRERAQIAGLPRSTALRWSCRAAGENQGLQAFLETPAGVAFLHRVVVAALFVILFMTGAGLRTVKCFLELAGLAPHVACSYGSLQKIAVRMRRLMPCYERQQRRRLASKMAAKLLSVALDETFFPEVCLVAMEPDSNFILVEKFAEKRDMENWRHALRNGLKGLPVDFVQSPSDEGKAILQLVQNEYEAQHAPDPFHVQNGICRFTSRPLARAVEEKRKAAAEANEAVSDVQKTRAEATQAPRRPGRPIDHDAREAKALAVQEQAAADLQAAEKNRDDMRAAIGGLGVEYHPYDLVNGQPRHDMDVERALHQRLDAAVTTARTAGLPERCLDAIRKARDMVPAIGNMVEFFHRMVATQLASISITGDVRDLVVGKLLPALYLRRVARQLPSADRRRSVAQQATDLLAAVEQHPAWLALDDAHRRFLRGTATNLVAIFQRSSSCVEGRNGRLSFFHHGVHTLRPDFLHCLTIVHNYVLRRPDGTTAAERLFGAKPDDLFAYLLEHLSSPPRPRFARRSAQTEA